MRNWLTDELMEYSQTLLGRAFYLTSAKIKRRRSMDEKYAERQTVANLLNNRGTLTGGLIGSIEPHFGKFSMAKQKMEMIQMLRQFNFFNEELAIEEIISDLQGYLKLIKGKNENDTNNEKRNDNGSSDNKYK